MISTGDIPMNAKSFTQRLTNLRTKLSEFYHERIQEPLNRLKTSLSRRIQALRTWLAGKQRMILWVLVLTLTAVLASVVLIYLYRRSATVRAVLDSLVDGVIGGPRRLWQWLTGWRRRQAATPAPATRPKAAPTVIIGDDRREDIPARPSVNSPKTQAAKS
jgi:hypothetical protein